MLGREGTVCAARVYTIVYTENKKQRTLKKGIARRPILYHSLILSGIARNVI
jgi:hypothetical protein